MNWLRNTATIPVADILVCRCHLVGSAAEESSVCVPQGTLEGTDSCRSGAATTQCRSVERHMILLRGRFRNATEAFPTAGLRPYHRRQACTRNISTRYARPASAHAIVDGSGTALKAIVDRWMLRRGLGPAVQQR